LEALVVPPPAFACVVAADEKRGIGRNNHLPWPRLKADIAHLKRITSATREPGARNAVIMGRRTWDSIARPYRPLVDRLNVVVSRSTPALPEGVVGAGSLDEALAKSMAAEVESVYVLGGGQLFAEAITDARCEVIYYTRILGRFDSDTQFPAFEDAFSRESVGRPHHEAGVAYQIERWRRRRDV
jgi:dihydrofolate reductase